MSDRKWMVVPDFSGVRTAEEVDHLVAQAPWLTGAEVLRELLTDECSNQCDQGTVLTDVCGCGKINHADHFEERECADCENGRVPVDICQTHLSAIYDEGMCFEMMARMYHETSGSSISAYQWLNDRYGKCEWLEADNE